MKMKRHVDNSKLPRDGILPRDSLSDSKNLLKPIYEAPVVMPLGDLARVFGRCTPGSGDSLCGVGTLAGSVCSYGRGGVALP